MLNLFRPLRKMCAIAGLAVLAVAAQALLFDGQIKIDRALDSPTLTVRYSNANAALVELRVNGESVSTRSVNAAKNSGETTFTLNLAGLNPGDNRVEIRLFDKTGKLLAAETTHISADQPEGPIFITSPKMGSTVLGKVDIKVGFSHPMKNSYVSFFIDDQFKSISNVPPFEFNWDTRRESNGWHEVEAWIVDDSSATYKTRKIRLFVQNPGGASPRVFDTTPANPVKPATAPPKPAAKPIAKTVPAPVKPSVPAPVTESVANVLHVAVVGAGGAKPATLKPSISTGLKEMTPTGTRLALKPAAKPPASHPLPPATLAGSVPARAATGLVTVARGFRLPKVGTFAIAYNSHFVSFDVQPRVDEDGVPLTPIRYLLETAGGTVDWSNPAKNVTAEADGQSIFLHIGDSFAKIDKHRIELEKPSFIDHGRTIVPLSFMRDALKVNIDYDKATGHVLITSIDK